MESDTKLGGDHKILLIQEALGFGGDAGHRGINHRPAVTLEIYVAGETQRIWNEGSSMTLTMPSTFQINMLSDMVPAL